MLYRTISHADVWAVADWRTALAYGNLSRTGSIPADAQYCCTYGKVESILLYGKYSVLLNVPISPEAVAHVWVQHLDFLLTDLVTTYNQDKFNIIAFHNSRKLHI